MEHLSGSPDLETTTISDPETGISQAAEERLNTSWSALEQAVSNNTEASIIVLREDRKELDDQERSIRQLLMASLGVKGHEVNAYPSEQLAGNYRYLERITTDVAGVEIVSADLPEGGRTLSLAVNHQPSDEQRVVPTDIERVLRTAQTHSDWLKSVERFGAHWNDKKTEAAHSRLLAIDIDECLLPAVDRRPASPETLKEVAERLQTLLDQGMEIYLNTGRSATETQKVLEYLERLGVSLGGAITEGGAISIRKGEDEQWLMERNPTIPPEQWEATQTCRQFIEDHYLVTKLGYAEPKISAVTFTLFPESEVTGQEICAQLRQLLVSQSLPTDVVDNADVSAGGLQLFSSGIDKAAGMRHLQAITGVSKAESVSIGDSRGDIPMFNESAITATPFNAARELSLQADYYSPFDGEYGVLDILNQLIKVKTNNGTSS